MPGKYVGYVNLDYVRKHALSSREPLTGLSGP